MIALNLNANGKEQEKIKAYLENNVSKILADKINNGVQIVKDGKTLTNKKDLNTFMTYAEEQVLKLIAENERKGRQMRCIDDSDVYGWAIHYFEEDSIEGKLYNEDGNEYKPPAPVKSPPTTPTVTYTPPKPQPKPQISMFDLLSENKQPDEANSNADDNEDETDELDDNELKEEPAPIVEQPKPEQPKPKGSAMWQHYLSVKEKYKDCIVFYRLGDFYEMFGEDAKIASDILNLTLTGRDCGLNERVPMAGVPFHAVDNYISKLVSKNYKVAVCEQLSGDVDRVIAKQPDSQIVDIKSGEILHTQEQSLDTDEDFSLSAFDKDAMVILLELFDGKIDLQ